MSVVLFMGKYRMQKCESVLIHPTNAYGGVEVHFNSCLTSLLEGGEAALTSEKKEPTVPTEQETR
jgi:hypothetical protein